MTRHAIVSTTPAWYAKRSLTPSCQTKQYQSAQPPFRLQALFQSKFRTIGIGTSWKYHLDIHHRARFGNQYPVGLGNQHSITGETVASGSNIGLYEAGRDLSKAESTTLNAYSSDARLWKKHARSMADGVRTISRHRNLVPSMYMLTGWRSAPFWCGRLVVLYPAAPLFNTRLSDT